MSSIRNQAKLADVKHTFQSVADHPGSSGIFYLSGGGSVSNIALDHIQGFAKNAQHIFIAVNQDGEKEGTIFIYDGHTKDYLSTYKIPVAGFNHPSGMQLVGDYLVVGIQSQDYNSNKVYCVNVADVNALHGFELSVPMGDQHCASVGITDVNVQADGSLQYLLVVSGDGMGTFFLSDTTKVGLSADLNFTKIKEDSTISFEGVNILTQADGKAFVIGFDSDGDGISFNDYLRLFELSGEFGDGMSIKEIEKKHIYSEVPLTSPQKGPLKPHCRYGSGTYVKDNTLTCIITGREPHMGFINPVLNAFTS